MKEVARSFQNGGGTWKAWADAVSVLNKGPWVDWWHTSLSNITVLAVWTEKAAWSTRLKRMTKEILYPTILTSSVFHISCLQISLQIYINFQVPLTRWEVFTKTHLQHTLLNCAGLSNGRRILGCNQPSYSNWKFHAPIQCKGSFRSKALHLKTIFHET